MKWWQNDKVRAGVGGLIKLWFPVLVVAGVVTPDAEQQAILQLALIGTVDFIWLLSPSVSPNEAKQVKDIDALRAQLRGVGLVPAA